MGKFHNSDMLLIHQTMQLLAHRDPACWIKAEPTLQENICKTKSDYRVSEVRGLRSRHDHQRRCSRRAKAPLAAYDSLHMCIWPSLSTLMCLLWKVWLVCPSDQETPFAMACRCVLTMLCFQALLAFGYRHLLQKPFLKYLLAFRFSPVSLLATQILQMCRSTLSKHAGRFFFENLPAGFSKHLYVLDNTMPAFFAGSGAAGLKTRMCTFPKHALLGWRPDE